MTKIKLSKRLEEIASLVDKNSIVADIGCDHALLDIYLLQNKLIKKAYACDVSKGALDQARKNISLTETLGVETRLGDGLSVITEKDNVDTIVISGLGNQKITEILKENVDILKDVKSIIVQSNTGVSKIRKSVIELGYYIKDEKLVEERGIIYTIIKFYTGTKKYNKRQMLFGPILLNNKDKLFYKLLDENISKNAKILENIPKTKFFKRIKFHKEIKLLKREKTC